MRATLVTLWLSWRVTDLYNNQTTADLIHKQSRNNRQCNVECDTTTILPVILKCLFTLTNGFLDIWLAKYGIVMTGPLKSTTCTEFNVIWCGHTVADIMIFPFSRWQSSAVPVLDFQKFNILRVGRTGTANMHHNTKFDWNRSTNAEHMSSFPCKQKSKPVNWVMQQLMVQETVSNMCIKHFMWTTLQQTDCYQHATCHL